MQRNNLMKNIPGNGYLTFICKIRTLSNYSAIVHAAVIRA